MGSRVDGINTGNRTRLWPPQDDGPSLTWVRLEESFYDHPKVVGLSDRAYRVFVNGLCYANKHLTDGTLSLSAQDYLRCTKTVATELLRAGLWELADLGAFRIHDYHTYQPTKQRVLEDRAAAKDRMTRFRSRNVRANNDVGSPEVHQPRTRPVPESLYRDSRAKGTTRSGELRSIRGSADRLVEDAGTRSDA